MGKKDKAVKIDAKRKKLLDKVDVSWMVDGLEVWIELNENHWKKAKIVFTKGKIVKLNLKDHTMEVEYLKGSPKGEKIKYVDKVFEIAPEIISVPDMCEMQKLNEAELSQNLGLRYCRGDYQTNIGPTLIVINPFKYIRE